MREKLLDEHVLDVIHDLAPSIVSLDCFIPNAVLTSSFLIKVWNTLDIEDEAHASNKKMAILT